MDEMALVAGLSEGPLQRLDRTMAPTPEWIQMRAAALDDLMRGIHPSNIHALQREAHGINEDISALRSALETQDITEIAQTLQSRARRVANKARRFRDKYAEIRPKLDKLKRELERVAEKCAEETEESNNLIAESAKAKKWRLIFAGLVLGGACLACVPTVGGACLALVSSVGRANPVGNGRVVLYAGAVAAFTLLESARALQAEAAAASNGTAAGGASRDLVQEQVISLWAAEREQHLRSRTAWSRMAHAARQAADNLREVCEKNAVLEQLLDRVVKHAEKLAAYAEDAQDALPTEVSTQMATLHEQVEKLCGIYAQVPTAFQRMCSSLPELRASLARCQDLAAESSPQAEEIQIPDGQQCPRLTFISPSAPVDDHGNDQPLRGSLLQDDVEDDGWILIPSAPLAPLLPPVAGTDCLPRSTFILIPVAEAARLGALLAAGPRGNNVIEVQAQCEATRLLRRFSFGGCVHELTGDHPIRVMRSGNWIQEQASTLQVGDVVRTSDGERAVEFVRAPRVSREEVFGLDVQNGGEIYVFTPSEGHLSWNGVAVLGSAEQTQRSRSAPPRWPSSLPSLGSRLCKGGLRCSNMCRNFKRGSCEQGKDCRFCHFDHAEESKRQPRGPRDGGSSRSSQSA